MAEDKVTLGQWLQPAVPARLWQALRVQPGFSLWSLGKQLETQEVGAERSDAGVVRRFRVPGASLEVEQLIEVDAEHGAAVFHTTLVQDSDAPSPPLERIEPLNVVLSGVRKLPRVPSCFLSLGGGSAQSYYPPLAYRENRVHVLPRGECEAFRVGSSPAGWSSDYSLPLLMLQVDQGVTAAGLVAGLEWSGEFEMEINFGIRGLRGATLAERSDDICVVGGPIVKDLVLDPGETLELPAAHVVFFEGSLDAGSNAIRRYLYQKHCPKLDGKAPLPAVAYDHYFGIADQFDEELLMRQARRCAEMGIEYFVLDAGWYAGCKEGEFHTGVGNWQRVELAKLPRGIEPLAEYVRQQGMKFGLFFDVERAHRTSDVCREHPEWFWDVAGEDLLLVNLGLPEAQEWVIDTVSRWIEAVDMRWTRWDFNIDPARFWREGDPTGKVQFAYMRGLYRVLDTLIQRYPQWSVETCSGGGRRTDLGTLRRAHSAWFSDHTVEPHVCRFMQTGASRFLPGNFLGSAVPSWGKPDLPNPALEFLSRMVGAFSMSGDVASWSPTMVAEATRHVEAYKTIRHLLVRDFYALTPHPKSERDWDAVQFVAYDGEESAVFAFRMDGDESEKRLRLKGLTSGEQYEVVEPLNQATSAIYSSATLREAGLPIALEKDQGKLYYLKTRGAAG